MIAPKSSNKGLVIAGVIAALVVALLVGMAIAPPRPGVRSPGGAVPTVTPTERLPVPAATVTPKATPCSSTKCGTPLPAPSPCTGLPCVKATPTSTPVRMPSPVSTRGAVGLPASLLTANDVVLRTYHDGWGLVVEHQPNQAPNYYTFPFPDPAYDKLLVSGYDITIEWGAGPGGAPLVTVVPPSKGDSK
jgi:hypothetical protein